MPPTHKPTSHRLKATQQPDFADLAPSKQELHILRRQLLHSHLVIVDRAINHVGLLLLQHHHSALDRVLDTKTGDDARAFLPDAVAAVGGLPFCGGIPPSVEVVKSVIARVCRRRRGFSWETYGSMIKTLEASVRLSATPPALSETRKTSTSVLFMKYSIDL